MLGLNMASSSVARIFGPMVAGALFSGLGHDWPFLIGALLTIPAAILAINAGRVIRRGQIAVAPAVAPAVVPVAGPVAEQAAKSPS